MEFKKTHIYFFNCIYNNHDFYIYRLFSSFIKGRVFCSAYYFRNKIIFGTIIGFIAYFIANKQKLFVKSLIFSVTVSVLLQTRYFLEGYSLDFVLLFLLIHFIILLPVSLIFFNIFNKYI